MFRHWITSIDYKKFIELNANQVTGRLSKKERQGQYKNPVAVNQRKKIIKIGKRR